MKSPEFREDQADAATFRFLLDKLFEAGKPRRHIPGMGLGEEEVLLWAPTSIIPPFKLLPDRVRAIRPKADNRALLKPRPSYMLSGHRLDVLQRFGSNRETHNFTEFYIHPDDGKIYRRKQYETYSQPIRHETPAPWSEVQYEHLPQWNSDINVPLSGEEIEALFDYIQNATPREPTVFE